MELNVEQFLMLMAISPKHVAYMKKWARRCVKQQKNQLKKINNFFLKILEVQ
jgi:hypothetical protein